jgi:hypothetical protein
MENYIIRIYRRDTNTPGNVTGLLESVERVTRSPFHSLNELYAILESTGDTENNEVVEAKN